MNLPKNWSQVSVGMFQEMYPYLTSDLPLREKVVGIISVSTGKSVDYVKNNNSLEELVKIAGKVEFLESFKDLTKVKTNFKLDKRYTTEVDFRKMKAAQYIDFGEQLKACKGDEYFIIKNMHKILACTLIERKRFKRLEYDGEGMKERAEEIKQKMSIKDAYPLCVFFCSYFQELTRVMEDYGNKQILKANGIIEAVLQDWQKDGVGT